MPSLFTLKLVAELFWRGLRLRCPRCGKGKIFRRGFTTFETCPNCGWRFEREEGYWTGAMAVNLILSEIIVAIVVIPLAAKQVPPLPLPPIGVPPEARLPVLLLLHTEAPRL